MTYIPNPKIEKREIPKRYKELFRYWKPKNNKDRAMVKKAFRMAYEAHKDMRRKSGEPYINHPINVALICANEIGLGTTSIICALLHDVVEDTDYTLEDIRGIFGDKVAAIIDGLTKIKGIFDYSTSSIHAENFKKILLTLSDDVRVILIKLADRLHNMRTLGALSREKQLKISSETVYLYAPLAHRLGLHAVKSELEDLALKYTEPEVFEMITRKLEETADERNVFIGKFVVPIRESLSDKGFNFNIVTREKSISAIWQKMQKKEVPFEEIYDIFAVRIIIDTPYETEKADCWKVYSAITDKYPPNMERLRDWISIPKANGYEALHTTVMSREGKWVEIQIRSQRMDDIAEKGYAAHWKYKESLRLNSRLDNWLDRIKEMIESPEADAMSFLDDVKGYFFLDEISVFTPRGELRTLPAGSTIVDFAYAIHSQLGNTCIGAKVDKKLVPLTYVLKNGQQVEILTSPKQLPKEDWLAHVVTTRARTNIRMTLKEEKKRSSRVGKERLANWFQQLGIPFTHENLARLVKASKTGNLTELYNAASHDKIGIRDVRDFLESPVQYKPANFEIARCCKPIPGDDVIGLVSGDLPVQIHRSKCEMVQKLVVKFGKRLVKVEWSDYESFSFLVSIKLKGLDKKGLINEITRIISNELDLNIKTMSIEANEGITHGNMLLYVSHISVLNNLLEKLRAVEGITRVERSDS